MKQKEVELSYTDFDRIKAALNRLLHEEINLLEDSKRLHLPQSEILKRRINEIKNLLEKLNELKSFEYLISEI